MPARRDVLELDAELLHGRRLRGGAAEREDRQDGRPLQNASQCNHLRSVAASGADVRRPLAMCPERVEYCVT